MSCVDNRRRSMVDRMTMTTAPARPYKVCFDLHVDGAPVRMVRSFATEEAARTYADVCTPDGDGKVYPNVREETWKRWEAKGFEYSWGVYWYDTNRPAVIMHWIGDRPDWV